jgi:hypothetical protein
MPGVNSCTFLIQTGFGQTHQFRGVAREIIWAHVLGRDACSLVTYAQFSKYIFRSARPDGKGFQP